LKWLLREGGSQIRETNDFGNTALILAAQYGRLETVEWLLKEGGSHIGEANHHSCTAMLHAAYFGMLEIVAWLLEHGGANIADVDIEGRTVWNILEEHLVEDEEGSGDDDEDPVYDATMVTALLRVMVLRGAPPAELTACLAPEHAQGVHEGARLRARLPAYLAKRRALLDTHCPLIAPLQDLVHGYEIPTTTDELWATGLGAARQRAVRPRSDTDAYAISQRRSARLRQKRE
jgi:hypothetical protein